MHPRAAIVAALALALALAAVAQLSACGGVVAADLFIVTRTGPKAGERLTLLVNEEGLVHCNGATAGKLSDSQLVTAHGIQEDLHKPASSGLTLAPAAGSVFGYTVRDESGTVSFADNSPGQPKVLHQLQLFVVRTAQQVCRLPE